MNKIILLFLLIIGIFSSSYSQNKRDKIKAFKIAHITERLDLSSAEAEHFWPIYNNFFTTNRQLKRVELKNIRNKIKEKGGIDNFSETEASLILEKLIRIEDKMYSAKKKMTEDLKKVISTKKIIKLYRAEREFNKKLLHQLRRKRRSN